MGQPSITSFGHALGLYVEGLDTAGKLAYEWFGMANTNLSQLRVVAFQVANGQVLYSPAHAYTDIQGLFTQNPVPASSSLLTAVTSI